MKKFIVFLIVSLLYWTTAHSQNLQLIDSIRIELAHKPEGKKRFDLLNSLAWEYRFALPDSTIFYAKQAYAYGQKLNLKTDLARPLNFIGLANNYGGNPILAFDSYNEALRLASDQHDTIQIAHANNNLGRLIYEQGLLARSYDYFIKSLSLFEAVGDSSGLAYTYQSLAELYKSQHDYVKAEANFLKAYKIRLSLKNSRDIMSALMQLGRLFQDTNQHDKALVYFHLADSAGNITHDEINLANIKSYISESYFNKGLMKEAEAICQEGLNVILRKNVRRMLPQAYITMAQIKFVQNDLPQTKKYLMMALDVAVRVKDINAKMKIYYWLWRLAARQKDTVGELRNQNQYLILKDSIKDLDLTRQVERLQFEIEIERKEQENNRLKANDEMHESTIRQQKLQNIILIVIIAFISILGFVQWRNGKKRREANEKLGRQNQFIQNQREEIIHQNEKLYRRNQELSDLNHEKDTLMSIVAHDLKSPLNRIKGIADLMEIDGGLSEDNALYMQMTKDATHAGLNLIKDLLDVHMLEENVIPNYSTFDISKFLLTKVKSFEPTADAKQIHLHITRIESEIVTLDADYLSRIVDNLISNAIKFSKRGSEIEVSSGTSGDHVWLSVKDQGPGFSDKDKASIFQKFKKLSAQPTAGETSNGLGLAIVKTLVDRLNGQIDLVSASMKGSEFIIRFPLKKK